MHSAIHRSALLLTALAAAGGCSTDGTVVIQNETATELSGEVDGRGYALSGYESIELTIKIGTRTLIFGPDTKDVSFSGESCTKYPFQETVTVTDGDPLRLNVQPDAVCIVLQNQGEFPVDRAYQRDHGETDWGPSLIDEPLYTTEAIRRRLAPGTYDFLLIDTCDDSTMFATGDELTRGSIQYVVHVSGLDGCPGAAP